MVMSGIKILDPSTEPKTEMPAEDPEPILLSFYLQPMTRFGDL